MLNVVAQRLIQAVITLMVLAVVIFALSRMSGDPVELMLPVDAT